MNDRLPSLDDVYPNKNWRLARRLVPLLTLLTMVSVLCCGCEKSIKQRWPARLDIDASGNIVNVSPPDEPFWTVDPVSGRPLPGVVDTGGSGKSGGSP